MKILFLGTSAGWPLPRLGCNCEICTSKDQKDKRLRPVILINDSVLVDAGPDIYHQLSQIRNSLFGRRLAQNKQFEIRNLKALILTHAHHDHILGFHDLTHLYNHSPNLSLYTTEVTLRELHQFFPFPTTPFKPLVVKAGEIFVVGNLKFNFIPVEHAKFPTWGVKIKGDRLLGYFPDFNKFLKSQEKTCRDLNFLIIDGSSLSTVGQSHNHENIMQGIKLGKKLKAKQVYFTHLGHKTGRHQDLEAFVQKEGGKNFHIAFDGLELEI